MKRSILLLGASLLVLVLAASCANDTLMPTGPSQDGAAGLTPNLPACIASDIGSDRGIEVPQPLTGKAIVNIKAANGGVVSIGRYSVIVPPRALANDTAITLTIKERTGFVECELLPHGIKFSTPVKLVMNLNGTSASLTDKLTVFWFDDKAGKWVDIGGAYDTKSLFLSVDLPHFSTYAAGRAGW